MIIFLRLNSDIAVVEKVKLYLEEYFDSVIYDKEVFCLYCYDKKSKTKTIDIPKHLLNTFGKDVIQSLNYFL